MFQKKLRSNHRNDETPDEVNQPNHLIPEEKKINQITRHLKKPTKLLDSWRNQQNYSISEEISQIMWHLKKSLKLHLMNLISEWKSRTIQKMDSWLQTNLCLSFLFPYCCNFSVRIWIPISPKLPLWAAEGQLKIFSQWKGGYK